MDSLPTEILGLVLRFNVDMCRHDKNLVLPLRLVCKAFDAALKPYIFRTVQLEFSRFLKDATPNTDSLARVGHLCSAVYMDMMVVRDEEEITRLSDIFRGLVSKVPEMVPLLEDLRRHCMSESTFDETDFRRVLENVLEHIPNTSRLKMNLPFQVVGDQSLTATLLLATTFASLAKRDEEHLSLETLVIDHVSDTTINNICNNPIDLKNAMKTFKELTHLVLSFKRQEKRNSTFNRNLWFLIRKAGKLGSLCLVGWNVKRDILTRRHRHRGVTENDWRMRSLPYPLETSLSFDRLRFLELKRVDIDPNQLVQLIADCSGTLKELYLVEVYIKVNGTADEDNVALWIGLQDSPTPLDACWVAQDLRNMKSLELDVLRVTGLGYDDFEPDEDSLHPTYDLGDPSGSDKSFDQRFVEAVMRADIDTTTKPTPPSKTLSPEPLPEQDVVLPPVISTAGSNAGPEAQESEVAIPNPECLVQRSDYDADTFQRHHNTTSHFKRSIDGYFTNHNEQALKELQNLISVADRGMSLISQEIERYRVATVDPTTGGMVTAPTPWP
ncbi:hypothetical protein LOCC1_G008603 [Lachnellula occidentalis]|uniref:Uncharacterized protein n=1 Tax=Lachnellula occidentalis TaxID=215460 RepID=A0A8H8RKR5_9HELO|nr:hypothetical protein LOCC1_G008603 [Lachnellula occidentalis]